MRQLLLDELAIDEGAQWLPLQGGRTNFTWQIRQGADVSGLVVKLYRGPANNPLFPNDPYSEASLLTFLQGKFPAQELIGTYLCEAGVCNVFKHIPGSAWSEGVAEVADLMRNLHGLDHPADLRHLPNGSRELQKHATEILQKCSGSSVLKGMEPVGSVGPSGRTGLLHSDIVPGNLIKGEGGLSLIDWQCPGIGDPCEDIAVFLSPAMQALYRGRPLTKTEETGFFDAYADERVAQRYQMLAPFYHWRMAAYCLWQSENGRPEYREAMAHEVAALQRSISL